MQPFVLSLNKKKRSCADSYDISLLFHGSNAVPKAKSGPANHPAQRRSPAIPRHKK